jgi:hypothetical protein
MPSEWSEGGDEAEGQAMRLMLLNIYSGASGMPLSPGAFNHYKFVYEGYVEERGRIINKIRVTPRRPDPNLFEGYLYIAENFWNVHEVDLASSADLIADVDFRFETNYEEVRADNNGDGGVWMPSNYRMKFDLSFWGSRGTMQFIGSMDYKNIVESAAPSSPLPVEAQVMAATAPESERNLSTREAYRLARRAAREKEEERRRNLPDSLRRSKFDLTEKLDDNYKVTADSLAGDPDPEFWDRHRPIELTPAELEGYRNRRVEATEKRDTTAHRQYKASLAGKILIGRASKPLKLGDKGGELRWRGLLSLNGGFNTVDGVYLGWTPLSYRKKFSEGVDLSLMPEAVWAIGRHVAMGTLKTRLRYAPMLRGEFNLTAGLASRDFHGDGGGIRPNENTVASLIFRRNYLKIYQDNFVEATNTIDLANGLVLTVGAKFARRLGLENTSDYSLFYRKERVYTPNIAMPGHNALTFAAELRYTPRQYYRISRGRKETVRSAWPTFSAGWRKGVRGPWGSVVDFDHLFGGLRQTIRIGPGASIGYTVLGGVFVNTSNLFFADVRHFDTADIPFVNHSMVGGTTFQLLPYYRYSTADRYLQAHLSYSARFFLMRIVPWFHDKLWMEGLQVNYLTTPAMPHYTELGYTIGLFWQAGVFVGFEGTKFRSWGAKLSIPLQFNVDGESASIAIAM